MYYTDPRAMETRHRPIWRARCSASGIPLMSAPNSTRIRSRARGRLGERRGEFEVEQFYVDRRLNEAVSARGGLFLMPFGLLNEYHDPRRFYGVQRNFVETLIIPSTWREGGFNLHGDTRAGFGWNLGLTTGFDVSKWDFAPALPPYTSALGLAKQRRGAAARRRTRNWRWQNAHHLSQYAALSYYGVPALLLGGAISTGESPAPGDPRVTLWERTCAGRPRSSTCPRSTRAARSATPGP